MTEQTDAQRLPLDDLATLGFLLRMEDRPALRAWGDKIAQWLSTPTPAAIGADMVVRNHTLAEAANIVGPAEGGTYSWLANRIRQRITPTPSGENDAADGNGLEDGRALNLGASYGRRRETSRIAMVVAPSGALTSFHRLPNGDLGEVTPETATHFGVHEFTVVRAQPVPVDAADTGEGRYDAHPDLVAAMGFAQPAPDTREGGEDEAAAQKLANRGPDILRGIYRDELIQFLAAHRRITPDFAAGVEAAAKIAEEAAAGDKRMEEHYLKSAENSNTISGSKVDLETAVGFAKRSSLGRAIARDIRGLIPARGKAPGGEGGA